MSTTPTANISAKPSSQHLRFASASSAGSSSSEEAQSTPSHSRAPSKASQAQASPPVSPRHFTFGPPATPGLSTPSGAQTPALHTPSGSLVVPQPHFPFPDTSVYKATGTTTTTTGAALSSPPSHAELSSRTATTGQQRSSSSLGGASYGFGYGYTTGSRPTTADNNAALIPGNAAAPTPGGGGSRPGSSHRLRETFASPRPRPLTMYSSVQNSTLKVQRERPKSTMLTQEKRDALAAPDSGLKPWVGVRDPHMRVAYWLTYGVMLFGALAGGVRCFFGWRGVAVMKGNLCAVLDEDFASGDEGVFGENGKFMREVDMSGFGNGAFEMTTNSPANSYIRDGRLYITPTLTSDSIGEAAIEDGHVFNITDCTFNLTQGTSYTDYTDAPRLHTLSGNATLAEEFNQAAYVRACSAVSNATTGAVINPVMSARLSTRRSASIRFGKVEVRAKIPTGDWLHPAIWMLPVDNVYGHWPASGEIDIMEARGNAPSYPKQGSNYVRGSLHWGPNSALDRVYKTYGWWSLRRSAYDQDFHTYTLEWDEDFMRISVDSKLHHMIDMRFKKSFWDLGGFPPMASQGLGSYVLHNIWANGTKAAPFDQKFYLIMDLGVGGTDGWFPDAKEKPWYDGSRTAMSAFWRARHEWLPTWPTEVEKRSLVIDSVKMWEKC